MSIRDLLQRLSAANLAYRNGTPVMSDAEYDSLEDDLVGMVAVADPSDLDVQAAQSFLASIGAPPDESHWVKARHAMPMGSLNKAQNPAEFEQWYTSCAPSGKTLVVSDKCDGISIGIQYVNGDLTRALTRGDGDEGEDITRNVRRMRGVVLRIPGFSGHIRGEIVLRKSDWRAHFPTYSNPRNGAAGISKRLDGVGVEHLTVLQYQLIRDGQTISNKAKEFAALKKLGAATPSMYTVASVAEARVIYDRYVATDREALDYDIDGLVVEFDDIAYMETLGDLNRRPRGAVAWKFPAMAKSTCLRAVRWQVGKSGRVTPVAEFDAVELVGASVQQASLHNVGTMSRLAFAAGVSALTVGSTVQISRRNDVIPYLEKIEVVAPQGAACLTPDTCPACDFPLIMGGEYLLCRGEDCSAQVLGGISRWVKKIGVLGLGDSVIETLIDGAGVTDPADLYLLDPSRIEHLTGSGGSRLGRTAHVVLAELHSKKALPLHVFVGSLGISLCSRSVCRMIVDAGFDTLDKMQSAYVQEIARIPKLGDVKAEAFVAGLRAKQTLIDRLLDNGVTILAPSVGVLTGKSVCMTGFRSPEMEKAVEDAGGVLKSSVGKGLTFLVCKDPESGSEKMKKATALGVQVVGIDDMWVILGGSKSGVTVNPSSRFAPKVGAAVAKVAPPPPVASVFDLFGDE